MTGKRMEISIITVKTSSLHEISFFVTELVSSPPTNVTPFPVACTCLVGDLYSVL